jgi:arsenate reductase (thioredoxin)
MKPQLNDPMTQSAERPKVNVLFVCFGNACRSQMAEALANQLGQDRVRAWSAGAYPLGWIPALTREVLQEKGISLDGHRTKGLRSIPLVEIDVVVEMEPGIIDTLGEHFKGRVIQWDIPDPFNGNLQLFRTVRDTIERQVTALLAEL